MSSPSIGWKAGNTDKLETLTWAPLQEDTVRFADWNDATLSVGAMRSPSIQPEIVFKLAKAPASADPGAVLAATEWIALGFEIADSGSHAALIVGEPVYVEDEDRERLATELGDFTVRVLKNNELVEEGDGKNALGGPALCVGELNDAMKRRTGSPLQAGDVITTGALTASLPMTTGDTWIASLSGIPPSALTLRVT